MRCSLCKATPTPRREAAKRRSSPIKDRRDRSATSRGASESSHRRSLSAAAPISCCDCETSKWSTATLAALAFRARRRARRASSWRPSAISTFADVGVGRRDVVGGAGGAAAVREGSVCSYSDNASCSWPSAFQAAARLRRLIVSYVVGPCLRRSHDDHRTCPQVVSQNLDAGQRLQCQLVSCQCCCRLLRGTPWRDPP